MLKKILLLVLGFAFVAIGIAGLALPILPGFFFLFVAAICFAAASTRIHGFLSRHPRLAHFFRRVEQSRELGLLDRIRLTFWACLEAISNPRVR